MSVICSKCREPLLGAVNRCWNCGAEMQLTSGQPDLPPVRRPVPAADRTMPVTDGPVTADASGSATGIDANETAGEVDVAESGDRAAANGFRPTRVGSPFGAATASSQTTRWESTSSKERSRSDAAVGGAIAVLFLGVISPIATMYEPYVALVIAGLGVPVGIWGVYSKRRLIAVVGLILCCLTFAVATVQSAAKVYTRVYGVSPWDATSDDGSEF